MIEVKRETIKSFEAQFLDGKLHPVDVLSETVKSENPELYEDMVRFLAVDSEDMTQDEKIAYVSGAMEFYQLMKMQIEVDELEQ